MSDKYNKIFDLVIPVVNKTTGNTLDYIMKGIRVKRNVYVDAVSVNNLSWRIGDTSTKRINFTISPNDVNVNVSSITCTVSESLTNYVTIAETKSLTNTGGYFDVNIINNPDVIHISGRITVNITDENGKEHIGYSNVNLWQDLVLDLTLKGDNTINITGVKENQTTNASSAGTIEFVGNSFEISLGEYEGYSIKSVSPTTTNITLSSVINNKTTATFTGTGYTGTGGIQIVLTNDITSEEFTYTISNISMKKNVYITSITASNINYIHGESNPVVNFTINPSDYNIGVKNKNITFSGDASSYLSVVGTTNSSFTLSVRNVTTERVAGTYTITVTDAKNNTYTTTKDIVLWGNIGTYVKILADATTTIFNNLVALENGNDGNDFSDRTIKPATGTSFHMDIMNLGEYYQIQNITTTGKITVKNALSASTDLTFVENGSETITISIRNTATNAILTYKLKNINIVEKKLITDVDFSYGTLVAGGFELDKKGSFNLPVTISPNDYTVGVQSVRAQFADNFEYAEVTYAGVDKITINVPQTVEYTVKYSWLTLTVTDEEGHVYTNRHKIYLTNNAEYYTVSGAKEKYKINEYNRTFTIDNLNVPVAESTELKMYVYPENCTDGIHISGNIDAKFNDYFSLTTNRTTKQILKSISLSLNNKNTRTEDFVNEQFDIANNTNYSDYKFVHGIINHQITGTSPVGTGQDCISINEMNPYYNLSGTLINNAYVDITLVRDSSKVGSQVCDFYEYALSEDNGNTWSAVDHLLKVDNIIGSVDIQDDEYYIYNGTSKRRIKVATFNYDNEGYCKFRLWYDNIDIDIVAKFFNCIDRDTDKDTNYADIIVESIEYNYCRFNSNNLDCKYPNLIKGIKYNNCIGTIPIPVIINNYEQDYTLSNPNSITISLENSKVNISTSVWSRRDMFKGYGEDGYYNSEKWDNVNPITINFDNCDIVNDLDPEETSKNAGKLPSGSKIYYTKNTTGLENLDIIFGSDVEKIYWDYTPFWVMCNEDANIAFYKTGFAELENHTIEYSIDKINWTPYTISRSASIEIIPGSTQGVKVYLRGDFSDLTKQLSYNQYHGFIWTSHNGTREKISIGGNIASLYGGKTDVSYPLSTNSIFYKEDKITDVSEYFVPKTLTKQYGYNMFGSCSSLTTPPDLSNVTSIGIDGCSRMFGGCSKLTTPPDLSNVTRIDVRGCSSMFGGCSKLTTPPDLSNVTSIGIGGCKKMFEKCTALTLAPDMSNVTSIDGYEISRNNGGCYEMFSGCSSLTTGPDMRSLTSIGIDGCSKMFSDCSNLTTPPNMSNVTSIDESGCSSMFGGCSSLTTGPDMRSLTSIGIGGCSNMFSGCLNLTTPPDLSNVTSIYGRGCSKMFSDCSNLTTPPDLSNVTSIGNVGCYQMFLSCSKLTTPPNMSKITSIGNQGCYQMFSFCSSMTTPPDMSKLTSIGNNGCFQMFSNCTALTTTPDLSNVTSIGSNGCTEMFKGCTGMTDVITPKCNLYDYTIKMFIDCTNVKNIHLYGYGSNSLSTSNNIISENGDKQNNITGTAYACGSINIFGGIPNNNDVNIYIHYNSSRLWPLIISDVETSDSGGCFIKPNWNVYILNE